MMNSNLKISLRFFPAKREEARPSFATREKTPALTFSFATAKRKEKESKERQHHQTDFWERRVHAFDRIIHTIERA